MPAATSTAAATREARNVLGRTVTAVLALAALNALVATFVRDPRPWLSFPLHDTALTREFAYAGSLVMAFFAWRLMHRGLIGWVGLTALLTWSVVGSVVLAAPGLPPPGIAPPAAVLVLLVWNQRVSTARSAWARDPRRAGTVYVTVGALVVSVLAVRALGAHFEPPIGTWGDATYFVLITFSTVGYGDIVPVTSLGRFIAGFVVVNAFVTFALAAGIVIPALAKSKFKDIFRTYEVETTSGFSKHVIVAGCSSEAVVLVEALRARGVEFVYVYDDAGILDEFEEVDFHAVEGDISDADTLRRANVTTARVLIAVSADDAVNAFTVLAARDVADDLEVIAMAQTRENVDKMRLAGADMVLSPSIVGGNLLARAALGETGSVEDLVHRSAATEGGREGGATDS